MLFKYHVVKPTYHHRNMTEAHDERRGHQEEVEAIGSLVHEPRNEKKCKEDNLQHSESYGSIYQLLASIFCQIFWWKL